MSACFKRWLICLLTIGALLPLTAFAHNNGKSYLTMNPQGAGNAARHLQWDLSFQDLDLILDLDRNLDGQLTRAELNGATELLTRLPAQLLKFSIAGEPCVLGKVSQKLAQKPAGKMMRLETDLQCPDAQGPLVLDYGLLAGVDASHRGWIEINGQSQMIKPGVPTRLAGTGLGPAATGQAFLSFVTSGIGHILAGWDHLAFLMALLIPVFLQGAGRETASGMHRLKRLFWVVSVFTLAHSLTLCLAVLEVVTVPAQPIEAAIAASIIFAALAGMVSRTKSITLPIAGSFGLLHGFGFANVMREAGASPDSVVFGLFGFNLGVEIGQLMFIAMLFPAFWMLARLPKTANLVAPVLSLLLALLGASWLIERISFGHWT